MPPVKAVIFDFIGTLTNVKDYSMEESKRKLCNAIADAGFDVSSERFLETYTHAHEKYRTVRYEQLVEVTNAIWISEALNNIGFKTTPEDTCVKMAVNVFFEEYVNSFELRPCVDEMLAKASKKHKLGLISNFTYTPVIYCGLRNLGISKFFNAVLVSEAVGWRKPHTKIFEEALRKLDAKAEETVYVGDSPLEDIKGAKALGMKTIFVPSQFYSLEFLNESQQRPDFIVNDICELTKRFSELIDGS